MTTKVADSLVSEMEALFLKRDAWQTWTPVVSQSAGITITINRAKYVVLGNTVLVSARITCTTAGTPANAILISGLPLAITDANNNANLGTVLYLDTGAAWYTGIAVANTATAINFRTNAATNSFGINPAVTIANGDIISLNLTYERV